MRRAPLSVAGRVAQRSARYPYPIVPVPGPERTNGGHGHGHGHDRIIIPAEHIYPSTFAATYPSSTRRIRPDASRRWTRTLTKAGLVL